MSTLDSHADLEKPTVTLPDLVRGHALERGREQAFIFRTFSRTGREAPTDTGLSYAELDRRARAVAAGLRRGDRVALLLPHSADFVVAFVGCLYAGAVAVPLHAPEPFRGPDRMYAVLRDCAPALALTSAQTVTATRKALENTDDLADLPLVDVADLVASGEGIQDPLPPGDPDAVAFLQYTSGSTGSPSGVRITHANLVVAARQITSHFPEGRTVVSWVPFFHDMGLVYGMAVPLVAGIRSVQFSAMSFVQNPLRWLEAISDYAADWTAVPNFGMEHCLGRSQDLAPGTDLSSMVALINGSEPVRASTLDQFTREYAPKGLRRSVMVPCYGLAEATLAVTATPLGAGSTTATFDRGALSEGKVVPVAPGGPESETVHLVACGVPMRGAGVRIVGTDAEDARLGREAEPGRLGRVWARGPNNADGYWRNPERSAERFREVDGRSWVDTGDLGFVHDGQIYLVGRSDNMFIVRGRNHYPEDIEATVRNVVPGTAAAFGDDSDGEQRLVIVLESTDHSDPERAEETAEAVREAVRSAHGVSVHTLYLVRRGTIPRTTSGKVQRGRSRDRHLEGGFGQGL